MIRVENIRTYKGDGIRVDRGTALGNPFIIGVHGTRDECVRKYRIQLWKWIQECNKVVLKELYSIKKASLEGDVVLLCWCKPQACHADIIKNYVKASIMMDTYYLTWE